MRWWRVGGHGGAGGPGMKVQEEPSDGGTAPRGWDSVSRICVFGKCMIGGETLAAFEDIDIIKNRREEI